MREVDARQLWQRILETRLQTGEPYLLFIDAVNRALPKHQRELGLKVSTSNLCSEITLPTGIDHRDEERTAVCCLSSLNVETWDDWHDAPGFIEDVTLIGTGRVGLLDLHRQLRRRPLCLGLRLLEAPAADPLDGRGSAARRRHQGLVVGPRQRPTSAAC